MTERNHVRTNICVGGPLDGQVRNVLHGNSFVTFLNDTREVYVGEQLHVGHTVYLIWRYEHMSTDEMFRNLMGKYAGIPPEIIR